MTSPFPGYTYNIKPRRVDFTKKAANKWEFLVTKNQEGISMDERILEILRETEADNEDDLLKALNSEGVSDEVIEVCKSIARLRSAFSDEVDGEFIAKALNVELQQSEPQQEIDPNEVEITKSDLEGLSREVRAKVEAISESRDELRKSVQDLSERTETLEKTLADKAAREVRATWERRVNELDNVSIEKSDLIDRMVQLEDSLGPDAANDHFETLRSADELAKQASVMTSEIGTSLPGNAGDAYDSLEAEAREIQKSQDISFADALDRAARDNPELAREYYEELRS